MFSLLNKYHVSAVKQNKKTRKKDVDLLFFDLSSSLFFELALTCLVIAAARRIVRALVVLVVKVLALTTEALTVDLEGLPGKVTGVDAAGITAKMRSGHDISVVRTLCSRNVAVAEATSHMMFENKMVLVASPSDLAAAALIRSLALVLRVDEVGLQADVLRPPLGRELILLNPVAELLVE